MDVHLSLAGRWVPCRAQTRACPRKYHLSDTTPAIVNDLPQDFLDQILAFQDPPTQEDPAGTRVWHNSRGMLHRDHDKPAYISQDGTSIWYQQGSVHRTDDKPAMIMPDGERRWYSWSNQHREGDKPAVIMANGTLMWYLNDELHREGGPAVIHADGTRLFYRHGNLYKRTRKKAR